MRRTAGNDIAFDEEALCFLMCYDGSFCSFGGEWATLNVVKLQIKGVFNNVS